MNAVQAYVREQAGAEGEADKAEKAVEVTEKYLDADLTAEQAQDKTKAGGKMKAERIFQEFAADEVGTAPEISELNIVSGGCRLYGYLLMPDRRMEKPYPAERNPRKKYAVRGKAAHP